jgi:hypothetical protein
MKGKRASVCLMLAVLLLFPFVCLASGMPADLSREQTVPTLSTESGGGAMNAANPLSVVPMPPEIEILWGYHMYLKCIYLLAAFFMQRALWKKARFAGICRIKNIRFLVESKTSHPQQAPPVLVQAFA